MFDNSYEDAQRRQHKADERIEKLNKQKQEATQRRIQQLSEQLKNISYGKNKYNESVQEARGMFEKFKEKNKGLYKMIYQGARQLDIRKKDLVEDIQGLNQISSNQY